jgi:transcriptional regulator with XRE-family HTH domain
MTFSEKIRLLRENAKLTQEALAAAAGVPLQTLRNIEQGKRENPRFDTVRKLSVALQLSLGDWSDVEVEGEQPAAKKPKKKT